MNPSIEGVGLDLKSLRLESTGQTPKPQELRPPRHKAGEWFLKGPIPWGWLVLAARLPGKAIHVAIVAWFLAGMRRSRRGPLPSSQLRVLSVSRFACYRGLSALEGAGLITVERHPGRSPIVTLLDAAGLDRRTYG